MKSEQDDKSLENIIRRAVGREDARFDTGGWKAKYREEVSLLESRVAADKGKWGQGRTIMGYRMIKIAASAAVAAVVVIAILIAMTMGDWGPSAAFAAALDQLRATSYEFEMDIFGPDGSSTSLVCMVLEPGKMRLEQRSGPGPIISVVDVGAGKALIILEKFKAVYRLDEQGSKDLWAAGFLALPGRSIENLWNLRVGGETDLGRKEIAGASAEGFKVTRKHDDATETITVWVDAKTHAPITVEIAWQPEKDEQQSALLLTLKSFRILEEPDVALFSTDVPEGYTLANQETLEQYEAGQTPSTSSGATRSAEAEKVLQAMALWDGSRKDEAIEMLMTVDWKGSFQFRAEEYLFTMTERQFVALVADDQREVLEQVMKQSSQIRAIARELVALGGSARAESDISRAKSYFNAAAGLGQLLDRDEDMMVIVRLVGIAVQKLALTNLRSLYEETGEEAGLEDVRDRQRQLDEENALIKKMAGGQ